MKNYILGLLVVFNAAYSFGQTLENVKMSPMDELLPNIEVLPIAVNYGVTQKKFIQLNKITRRETYKCDIKSDGQTDSVMVLFSNFVYDDKNQIIEQQDFDAKQKLQSKESYSYNESNLLVKKTISHDKKPEPESEFANVIFDYGRADRLEQATYFNADTTYILTLKYLYNDSNQVIKHLQKAEVSDRLMRTQTQKVGYSTLQKIFKIDEVHKYDSLLYDTAGRIKSILNYDLAQDASFSYLFEYKGTEPVEIVVTRQAPKGIYAVGKTIRNRFNQILFRSEPSEHTEVADHDPKTDNSERLIYNPDGTLNTFIGYSGKKVKYIYKYFYKK